MTFRFPAQPATTRNARSRAAETRRMRARRYWKAPRGSTAGGDARRAPAEIRERDQIVHAVRGDRRREAAGRREEEPEPRTDHAGPEHVRDAERVEEPEERARRRDADLGLEDAAEKCLLGDRGAEREHENAGHAEPGTEPRLERVPGTAESAQHEDASRERSGDER